jgi:RIO kinase 1
LTGHVEADTTPVDLEAVLQELEDTRLEEEARQRHEEALRSGA